MGGVGSGHYGHEGVPGHKGGSAPSSREDDSTLAQSQNIAIGGKVVSISRTSGKQSYSTVSDGTKNEKIEVASLYSDGQPKYVDELRVSESRSAKVLRGMAADPKGSPRVLSQPHFRGMSLSEDQIGLLREGDIISLDSIASFTRDKDLALRFMHPKSSTYPKLGERKVLFSVPSLKRGTSINSFVRLQLHDKGDETITTGSLRITAVQREDNLLKVEALHR